MDESAAWCQACSFQSRSEPALPSLSQQLLCQGLQAGTGLLTVPGTRLDTASTHRIFLLFGKFSQGLITKSILSPGAPGRILALGHSQLGVSRARPLPASELLPYLEALTSTTCPTLDPRSHPSSLGLSSYLENLTGILVSPRAWPPIDLLLTHPVPGALT